MKYLDLNGLTSLTENIKKFFANTMSTHDTSGTSHKDIRDKIENINDTIGYMNDDEFLTLLNFNDAHASEKSADTGEE